MVQIEQYLIALLEKSGSDLHLSSGVPPLVRKDGDLLPIEQRPLPNDVLRGMVLEIMPARNREEFETESDTDFAHEIEGRGRFRINAFMTSLQNERWFRERP